MSGLSKAEIAAQIAAAGGENAFAGLSFAFDSATADADPGAGNLRFDNATLTSATQMFISGTSAIGTTLSGLFPLLNLQVGSTVWIFIQQKNNPAKFAWAAMTGAAINAGAYFKFPLSVVNGDLDNGAALEINLITPPAGVVSATAVQDGLTWAFDGASQADANPGAGKLRANNATPSLATQIFIHPLSKSGVGFGTLLGLQDAPGFIYLEQRNDPTRWALFDVTGLTVAGAGYSKLQVAINGVGPGAEIQDLQDVSVAFLAQPPSGGGGGGNVTQTGTPADDFITTLSGVNAAAGTSGNNGGLQTGIGGDGTSTVGGDGGDLLIATGKGGDGVTQGGVSGQIDITTGPGGNGGGVSGAVGTLNITGGVGGSRTIGGTNGGFVNITGGLGGLQANNGGAGGFVRVFGGAGEDAGLFGGAGGTVEIRGGQAGSGTTGAGAGGNLLMRGGDSQGGFPSLGGVVTLRGGVSGGGGSSLQGASVTIEGGIGGGTYEPVAGKGGDLILRGGQKGGASYSGSGPGGDIFIRGGTGFTYPNQDPGKVIIGDVNTSQIDVHKALIFKAIAADPTTLAGECAFYAKDVGAGVIELFHRHESNGAVSQIS
jgi:hypothetical protein